MNLLDQAFRDAAHVASDVVAGAMRDYRNGLIRAEPELTPDLMGRLRVALSGEIDGLIWQAAYTRNDRGKAAEESIIGADIVIHVKLDTPELKYSKGVLVQAKRYEKGQHMNTKQLTALRKQCNDMLAVSSHSWVFDYTTLKMRCGSATKLSGSTHRDLFAACDWTPYRFFLELFRCQVGDPRITGAKVTDLPVEHRLELQARGDERLLHALTVDLRG
jgi:hypothetical protein